MPCCAGLPIFGSSGTTRARQAHAERVRGELQRSTARRVPQRARLHHAGRGPAHRRSLAHRLQHGKAARSVGQVASGGVRRYAQTRRATGRDAALDRGLRAPPRRTINHQSKRGTDSTCRRMKNGEQVTRFSVTPYIAIVATFSSARRFHGFQ